MKKLIFCFLSVYLISCTTQSNIQRFNLDNNITMYFFPATDWKTDALVASVDFNYKTETDIPVICNITIQKRNSMIRTASSFIFYADSAEYSLSDVRILRTDNRNSLVRITSVLDHDDFLRIIDAENVLLRLTVNDVQYECSPSKNFDLLRDEFLNNRSVYVY